MSVGRICVREVVLAAPDETVAEAAARRDREPEGTPIEDALSFMAAGGHRRLVVTDEEDRLVGILSVDDVVDLLVEEAGSGVPDRPEPQPSTGATPCHPSRR